MRRTREPWDRALSSRASCSKGPVCVSRDGPDQNSPQLGVFSGNTALETAHSSTSQVLLKFHSDFSNGGFFVLNFHGQSPPPSDEDRESRGLSPLGLTPLCSSSRSRGRPLTLCGMALRWGPSFLGPCIIWGHLRGYFPCCHVVIGTLSCPAVLCHSKLGLIPR